MKAQFVVFKNTNMENSLDISTEKEYNNTYSHHNTHQEKMQADPVDAACSC